MKFVMPQVIPIKGNDVFRKIEKVGRVCYKSEDKITNDSAKKFVKMLESSGHGAALEHGIVYLTLFLGNPVKKEFADWFKENPYSTVAIDDGHAFITTNYRVISENLLEKVMDWAGEKTNHHVPIFTFKIICSRAVANEFVRHRKFSFMQESTRYCNYSKDKFGGELTFVIPTWMKLYAEGFAKDTYIKALEEAERAYMNLINEGLIAQYSRGVLPLDTKTELVMTGSLIDWYHFLKLRSSKLKAKGVHPDALYIADLIYDFIFKEDE